MTITTVITHRPYHPFPTFRPINRSDVSKDCHTSVNCWEVT